MTLALIITQVQVTCLPRVAGLSVETERNTKAKHENRDKKRKALTNKQEMLKTREECNPYLIHVCRHCWNGENPVKRSNIELSSPVDVN